MGKKRKKIEKNFPRHVVTGVAMTSLAFGVLTNASGFENLFEPQTYKNFETQQKNKKSDYASGNGKDAEFADKNKKKQKDFSNKNVQQALKLPNTQINAISANSDLKRSDDQATSNTQKTSNTFTISNTDGDGTISTNPNNSSQTTGNNDSNNTTSPTTPGNQPSDDTEQPGNDQPSNPTVPSKPSIPDHDEPSAPTWEEEQLKPKDPKETKYGTIQKLTAVFTKEEYSPGEHFQAKDAIVTGTFIKDGEKYTKELPYGGDDGYNISFSSNRIGNQSAVFSFGGMTTRSSYNVSSNHVILNFYVLYDGGYYAAQFNGNVFDFLTEDVQEYLSSLNKIPYTYPQGGYAINLQDMHQRMIAYLLDERAKESILKMDGNYRNVNFLEESSDGYLQTMLEGFRFTTNKQLVDTRSYIYYPTDQKNWNYSINSKQVINMIVSVPKEFKIKRVTTSENDWKSYRAEQVLEDYTGKDQNLSVPMGTTMICFKKQPSNAKVTTLTLPESVHEIDIASVADYLPDLESYAYSDPSDTLSINYRDYKIIDGVLYSKDGTTLLSVPPGRTKKLVIPSTVTTLAKDCFKNLSLDQIYFEDANVPSILGDTGYSGKIIVPESNYDIVCKNYMFAFQKECDRIDFVSDASKSSNYSYDETTNTICDRKNSKTLCAIPSTASGLYTVDSKYETIDEAAFYGNTSITDIELSDNTRLLKNHSLIFSGKISSISCKSSNMQIDSYIFGDPNEAKNISDIKIYVNTNDYEKYLKDWTPVLDPIYGTDITKTLLSYDSGNIIYEDGAKYQKYFEHKTPKYRLLKVYDTKKTALKIKDGTTQIADQAFDECNAMEILYLSSDLTSFDPSLLKDCSSLETIINPSKSLSISSNAFGSSSETEIFNLGANYRDFVYENGVVYGKSIDDSYTLLNVPTNYKGNLILKDHTKKLYDKALYACNQMTDLVISDPTSLKEIGNSCFENNIYLKQLDLSELTNLEFIGASAFKNCEKLTELILPDQLQTVQDQTFYGCTSLEKVKGDGILFIKDEAFAECLSLSKLEGFDHVKELGNLAFYDCQSITDFILPESVSKIGEECFENCINLRVVAMNGSISAISRYCFYGCEKLADFSMSGQQQQALKVIGVEAFAECKSLKNPDFSNLKELHLIGEGAFKNCSEMISMKLPASLEKLPTNCFSGCNNLSALQLNSEKITTLDASVFGEEISHYLHILVPDTVLDQYKEAYKKDLDETYGDGISDKILGTIDAKTEYLKGIRYELTENGRILKEVSDDFEGEFTVLEDTIKIDDDAFRDCSKITKLTIPQDAKVELGNRCFKNCKNLKEIELYGDIPVWNDETFMGCSALEKVVIGYSTSDIKEIGTRAFKGCNSLSDISSIVISAHVNTIKEEAFMDCENLPAVGFTINTIYGDARKSLQVIGNSAFENCKKLTTFLTTTFSNVTTIGDYAFKGCDSLKQPSLAQSVTSIGKGCFMDCSNLLYVSFYGAVQEFPQDCFKNCPKLIRTGGTALAFSSLKHIGDGAYEGCRSLTSSTSWYLERYANLETIGEHAFKDCKNLANSSLSSTVTAIGAHAFDGCSNMKVLTFKGTTPPNIGVFLPETMADGFLFKVPDSKESGDNIYKAYFEQLNKVFENEDLIYSILDSISDGAKDRATTEVKTKENEEISNDH